MPSTMRPSSSFSTPTDARRRPEPSCSPGPTATSAPGLISAAWRTSAFTDLLRIVLATLRDDPRPVLAAVDGAALGAGTQLAVACDLRVATPSARFGIPAARLGLCVDHWTVDRLARLAGGGPARAMLVGAEVYSGEDAHRFGFVQRLGGLDEALGWADELAAMAPLTIAAHKAALNQLEGPVVRANDDAVLAAMDRAWGSEDLQEGMAAFNERRRPHFRGR